MSKLLHSLQQSEQRGRDPVCRSQRCLCPITEQLRLLLSRGRKIDWREAGDLIHIPECRQL